MAIFNGTKLGIFVDGTLVAAATDCSMSLSGDTIDITTKDSAGWRELLPGTRSGSLSVSGLIDYQDASNKDVTDLFAAFNTRSEVTFKFSDAVTGDQEYTGSALITSLEQSGGTEDTATYSASLEVNGVIAGATIS